MAQRQLAERQVTDIVLPDDRTGEMLTNAGKMVMGFAELKKKDDIAKMNDYASDANLQLMRATNDWRVKNASNPLDPKAIEQLNSDQNKVFSQYDDKIGVFSKGDWQKQSQKIIRQYQEDNLQWGIKQSVQNFQDRVNGTIKKDLFSAQEYGRSNDLIRAKSHFEDSLEKIRTSSSGVIPEEKIAEITTDFKADYSKSYIVGLADTDPDKALSMLKDEKVREEIGDAKNIRLLEDYAKKKKNDFTLADKALRTQIINDTYLKIVRKEPITFTDVDNLVGKGIDADDAEKLKKMIVQQSAVKSNPLVVAEYISELSSLDIDSEEDAEKIKEMIMMDKDISDRDKKMIIFNKNFEGQGQNGKSLGYSLQDVVSGKMGAEDSGGGGVIGFLTGFKPLASIWNNLLGKTNKADAVEAFRLFTERIKGNETPDELNRLSNVALAEVAGNDNPFIKDLGEDWVEAEDVNGNIFRVRKNEFGEVEIESVDFDLSSDDEEDNNNSEKEDDKEYGN